MRVVPLLLASALLAGAAQAQSVSPLTGSSGAVPAQPSLQAPPAGATAAPPSAPPSAQNSTAAPATRRGRHSLAQRFDAANTTHDGKLTLSQARAGHMNAVARDFSKIDTAKKGYVTMDDIHAYNRARRAASHSSPAPAAQ